MGWLQEKLEDVKEWAEGTTDQVLYADTAQTTNEQFTTLSGKPIGIPGIKLQPPGILTGRGLPGKTRSVTAPTTTTTKGGNDWVKLAVPVVVIGGLIWFVTKKKK